MMVQPMLDKKIWNALSHFQTHDLVRQRYERKHGRKLNAQRTWEISSCFIQGQEYFENAAAADETVRPLLLYYGVLSLSKGLILFLDRSLNEESMKPGHGLSAKGWPGAFGTKATVLDLEVEVADGTFLEFVNAVSGYETGAFATPDWGIQIMPFAETCSIAAGQIFRLDNVFSRIPKLWHTYRAVTGSQPASLPGMLQFQQDAFVVCVMMDPVGGAQSSDEVRRLFQVPSDIEIGAWPAGTMYGVNHFGFRVEKDSSGSFPAACPVWEEISGGFGNLIAPWPNGVYVSPATKLFIVAYFMGMLVRYFPSRWMALIRGQKGDGLLPLLREAIDQVEQEFPEHTLGILGWA
jgi:hypothetical protein